MCQVPAAADDLFVSYFLLTLSNLTFSHFSKANDVKKLAELVSVLNIFLHFIHKKDVGRASQGQPNLRTLFVMVFF